MPEVHDNRRNRLGVKLAAILMRLAKSILILLVGLFFLYAALILVQDLAYLGWVAFQATALDAWTVLNIISLVFSIVAVAGGGLAIARKRWGWALAFSILVWPPQVVIDANRCDVVEVCRDLRWAQLPASAFEWRVRIRPVSDPEEAKALASNALATMASDDSPYMARRFGDHWIVSTIDDDGWPGAHALRIDAKTTVTERIPCPAGRIPCGMARPTLSDGERPFHDDRLGIAATFPRTTPVCTARNDDGEARGFFAMVRAPGSPCEILDQSRVMGIEIARSPKQGCRAKADPSLAWRELSPSMAKLFDGPPRLGSSHSRACELHQSGFIQISVYAPAPAATDPKSSEPLYEAYIVTTREHLVEDVRTFEAFLKRLKVQPGQGTAS
ncbi:hypothetical protein [Phenylobacterium zucineum]|uniref:hypothetical protein n=1 Tax=Phenylobacterium zucineum TaxID=284016 RepID=UPI0002E1B73E|nr:hypothetical protein [Phenylobacterium zucineum]